MDLIWRFDQVTGFTGGPRYKESTQLIRVTFFHEAKPLHYCVKHLDKPCKLNKSTTMHLLNISESYLALNIVNVRWWSGYNLFFLFTKDLFVRFPQQPSWYVCLLFTVSSFLWEPQTSRDRHVLMNTHRTFLHCHLKPTVIGLIVCFSDVKCGFNGFRQVTQVCWDLHQHAHTHTQKHRGRTNTLHVFMLCFPTKADNNQLDWIHI